MNLTMPNNFIKALFGLNLILTVAIVSSRANDENNIVPVIGVFTRNAPGNAKWIPPDLENSQFIPASYVKWLESAGARSIAIDADASDEQIKEIFKQVNGVLIPGGVLAKKQGNDTTMEQTYQDAAKLIWDLAKQANEEGEVFPIWGTCLGFQWMVEFEATDKHVSASW